MAKHRATGNPRGRPRRIPEDFGDQIVRALRKRVNPETGLVSPLWKQLARELGVSRSTIARHMVILRGSGAIESIFVKTGPKYGVTYYRIKVGDEENTPSVS